MKFVAISDTHGLHRDLILPEGDVILFAGDFCQKGSEKDLYDFLKWYENIDFKYKVLIAGNHDSLAEEQPAFFRSLLPKEVMYLNDSGIEIEGIKIWGSPVQPDMVGWAFGKTRGTAMKAHWDLIPTDTQLLITHTPPFGILDLPKNGHSFGCEELAKRLDDLHLAGHVFGHVHHSYGTIKKGNTLFINAANFEVGKGIVNAPIVFEL